MAEKSPAKKKSTASARQQMLETFAETSRQVEERKDDLKPEDRLEAKSARDAVTAADALSTDGVVKSIGELRSNIGKTLAQLSDRLEEEVGKYVQIQRAILAKEAELKEIYEIQKSASTLTALIESQQNRKDEFESEMAAEKEALTREIETTRADWESERKLREAEIKEQTTAEQKRRDRERDEYRYTFAREQQLAKDKFADEMARAEKEMADRTAESNKQLQARESAIADREKELTDLRNRVAAFPKELDAAIAKSVKETTDRVTAASSSREELLKREFAGEPRELLRWNNRSKNNPSRFPACLPRRRKHMFRCRISPSKQSKDRRLQNPWPVSSRCSPTNRAGPIRRNSQIPFSGGPQGRVALPATFVAAMIVRSASRILLYYPYGSVGKANRVSAVLLA